MNRIAILAVGVAALATLGACTSSGNTERGALGGAALGAAAGAIIGNNTGSGDAATRSGHRRPRRRRRRRGRRRGKRPHGTRRGPERPIRRPRPLWPARPGDDLRSPRQQVLLRRPARRTHLLGQRRISRLGLFFRPPKDGSVGAIWRFCHIRARLRNSRSIQPLGGDRSPAQ